jgi:alpha-glucosidase
MQVGTASAPSTNHTLIPQWDASDHAGFSTTEPWMRIPDDYKSWNVANQIDDPSSVLSFWKEMLAKRKQYEDELVSSSPSCQS